LAALALVALAAFGCREADSAPVYQALAVERRDIVVSASAAGSIEPVLTVEIKSKASGEIMDLRVDTGDEVEQGQLVALIDPRVPRNDVAEAQAQLEVAEAQLQNAESQLRRSDTLYKTQSITEQEFEASRLTYANAKASLLRAQVTLQMARDALEDTRVVAPINGTIIQKNVERGQVISSPTRDVGGGTVLMRMANLDTVQVRAMVDETDIGKVAAGLETTVTVEAYPQQPFTGAVLKIEPLAEVSQNVTMFPVLIRIDNRSGLLKPGMNAEVEIHIGRRDGVLAVPVAALRSQRDVASAAEVLGLSMDDVQRQLAAAQERPQGPAANGEKGDRPTDSTAAPDASQGEVLQMGGREVRLPQGVSAEQARAIFAKMQEGGGPNALSAAERQVMQRVFRAAGGRGGRGGGMRPQNDGTVGGTYIVFTLVNGQPVPQQIRTGLSDLDYAEVVRGLEDGDTVLLLPSASLLESQDRFRERIQRNTGIPGVSNQRR
jgi:HlyD family secretion protein